MGRHGYQIGDLVRLRPTRWTPEAYAENGIHLNTKLVVTYIGNTIACVAYPNGEPVGDRDAVFIADLAPWGPVELLDEEFTLDEILTGQNILSNNP